MGTSYFKEKKKIKRTKEDPLKYLKYKHQRMICFLLLKVQISIIIERKVCIKVNILKYWIKVIFASEI